MVWPQLKYKQLLLKSLSILLKNKALIIEFMNFLTLLKSLISLAGKAYIYLDMIFKTAFYASIIG